MYCVSTSVLEMYSKKEKNMEKNLIMYNSATLVMRSRDILSKHRISSKVIRTPANLRGKSCGYSLYINNNFDYAMDILGRFQIPILGTAVVDFK